jgi:hypothetical protein
MISPQTKIEDCFLVGVCLSDERTPSVSVGRVGFLHERTEKILKSNKKL